MGAVAYAAASLGVAAYGVFKGTKQNAPVTPTLPEAPSATQQNAIASSQAASAAVRQRQRAASAKGNAAQVKTTPLGLPNAPAPGRTTLLGL